MIPAQLLTDFPVWNERGRAGLYSTVSCYWLDLRAFRLNEGRLYVIMEPPTGKVLARQAHVYVGKQALLKSLCTL